MQRISQEPYLVGAYAPSLLFDDTPDLPRFDYPDRIGIPKDSSEASKTKKLLLNGIPIIIITALIFIAVVTWFNVFSHFYEDTFHPNNKDDNYLTTKLAFGYAVLVTIITIIILVIFYHVF